MTTVTQIRMARAGLGWSLKRLAEAAGVGLATVARFEGGKARPIPATLAAMRRALEDAGAEFQVDGSVRIKSAPASPP
jgi:transcriptional regulator with XRE-family HTH domain